jgi:hypothetical protein
MATINSSDLSGIESGSIATTGFLPLPVASDGSVLSTVCEHGRGTEGRVKIPQRGR